MQVNLPNAAILPWDKHGSPIHVGWILKPVLSGLCSAWPRLLNPITVFVFVYAVNRVIKSIRLVVSTANADDVDVVLAVQEDGMT